MKRLVFLIFMGAAGMAALLLGGCTPPSNPSPASEASSVSTNRNATATPARQEGNTYHLNQAQPKLRTMTLYLGRKEITAEIALTRTEISTGMMFRESMAEDEGMLFVFPMAHQTGFYMKNTKVPLSVAYIDPDGAILEINDLKPLDETPVLAQTDQVQFVLEMNQGWFRKNQIDVGAVLTTQNGTLRETFFPRRF